MLRNRSQIDDSGEVVTLNGKRVTDYSFAMPGLRGYVVRTGDALIKGAVSIVKPNEEENDATGSD